MKVEDFDVEEFEEFAASYEKKAPPIEDIYNHMLYSEGQLGDIFKAEFESPDTKKIVAIIKKEPALITGELISVDPECKNPRHCVVGALFYHAGVSNARLKDLQKKYGAGEERFPAWAHEKLWKHYRLSPLHTAVLMGENDSKGKIVGTCEIVNKAHLIKEVEALPRLVLDMDEMFKYTRRKGGREFLTPFIRRAYNKWISLGIIAMAEQARLRAQTYKNKLPLKAKKK
jgi:hypothetical protein